MKKHLLRALCIAFILTLCLPMTACSMEWNGLVGELLQNNNTIGAIPQEWESNIVIEDILPEIDTAIDSVWEEDFTGDIGYTEKETEAPPVGDTAEPDILEGDIPCPALYFSFDECDAWVGEQQVELIFTPGAQVNWNSHAIVNDYSAEYIRISGWVAFTSEQIGEIGYSMDGGEYVFDRAFLTETEQSALDAAAAMGAGSASGVKIMIPVREISGNHVIEIIARDEFGYSHSIAYFTFEKAKDPYAPVFVFDAATIAELASDAADMPSPVLSDDGSYTTLATLQGIDPYFNLKMCDGTVYESVRYIVIAYRTEYAGTGQVYVGSVVGPWGTIDEYKFDYVADGTWNSQIIDTEEIEAINDAFVMSYLRYDIFHNPESAGQSVDIAYIAGFDSMEDVMLFFTENPLK